MQNQTNWLIAHTLEALLTTTPFEKVRVTTLCRACQISPQTFYNHFTDKYALVAWMFRQDYIQATNQAHSYTISLLIQVTQQLLSHKNFYQQVYQVNSQNSINHYIYQFNLKLATQAVMTSYHQEHLTVEQTLVIKYHTYGTMALFQELLYDQLDIPLNDLCIFEYQRTPDFLKQALSERF